MIHLRPTGSELRALLGADGCFLGIDNGLSGGLAYVRPSGELVTAHAMPTMPGPVGRVVDCRALAALIPTGAGILCAALERPDFVKDFKAGRSMFDSFAVIRTVLYARGLGSILFPVSQQWQREFWIQPKREKDAPKFDTKAAAVVAAKKRWPEFDFRATGRSSKAHDGIVDACLLAEFARKAKH